MHVGLVMECDYRYGDTEQAAFDEAFAMADAAEAGGFDGVWLAERHFAAPLDPAGAGIPSIVSAPLIISSAIVSRTQRLRVGVAVNVLPLSHPVRLAEEVATVDQISRGRVDFGVGRSGFARSYEGYGIPYGESRERFQECLEIILAAWSNERFSYEGKYYTFNDVCVIPKPFQKPHPPLRVAATTSDTFPVVGAAGLPVFGAASGGWTAPTWCAAWTDTGRPGGPPATRATATCTCEFRCSWERATNKPTPTPRRAPCVPTNGWPGISLIAPPWPAPLRPKKGSPGGSGWRR